MKEELVVCHSCLNRREVYGYALMREATKTSGPFHKIPFCKPCYLKAEKDGLYKLEKKK